LFVSRITQKLLAIFTKFEEKVAQGTRKKTLDFDGNPDHHHITTELGLGQGCGYA